MRNGAARLVAVVVLALLGSFVVHVASAANAEERETRAPACKRCESTGRLPCTEHPRTDCESEDEVLYCSVVSACPVCSGVGWIACPECKNDAAREAIAKRIAAVGKCKIELTALDEKLNRALCKVETRHFVLVWDLERIKVDKKYLNQHEGMHLYARRLEALFADYLACLHLSDKDFREKFRIFVWWLPKDHHDASLTICGQNSGGGVKLLGTTPAYSVCGNKQNFQDDEKLHRNLVHSVTHLLLSSQQFPQWMGNTKGGWCDEGLSHWFEDRYWGLCDNYCYQESNSNVDFKSGKWKLAVRKLVEMDKQPSVAEVFECNTDTLTLPGHAVSFSYVDYLLTRDAPKFTALCAELKMKVPTREALKKLYGFAPIEFEQLWKAWVLQTYPTK